MYNKIVAFVICIQNKYNVGNTLICLEKCARLYIWHFIIDNTIG